MSEPARSFPLNADTDAARAPRVKVGLVQINNSFSGQNYLPYSVGILQAYAQKHLKNPAGFEFMLPIYLRGSVEESIEKLLGADYVFFSAYVWNIRISLEIAKGLKARKPSVVIVFGGPQVPDRSEEFLRKNPFIDLACHGEGETIFVSILEHGLERARRKDFGALGSVSFINDKGELVVTPKNPRLETLDAIPSPYLSGVFEPLMKANPKEHWIVLWETNRGCPFQCTFCDWGSATATKVYKFDMERLHKEVEWFAKNKIEFIFCADANFGMFERDYDIAADVAKTKETFGYPHALSVQNTKNATERAYKVQKLLADSGLNKGVTISLQSVDPDTLKKIKRANISTNSFQELQRRFTKDRVETYSDIILGLPGETYDSFTRGVANVIEHGQHNRIQFNNLSILPNAAMGDPDYQREHGMEIVETGVVNIHGSLATSNNEVNETQQLVVATKTCPKPDWIRTRTFSWFVGFLYFDKLLQIPLLLLLKAFSIKFNELIAVFMEATPDKYPVIAEIRKFFEEKALDIQNGGAEYCASKEWLNIWWPADELVLIKLCTEGKLEAFYKESEAAVAEYLDRNFVKVPADLLHEMFLFNQALLKRPFQKENLTVDLKYNIVDVYRSALVSESLPLEERPARYFIDRTSKTWNTWDDWCREVVWWGNKKGAYLYGNTKADSEMAGHF